jgi:hypothetical protein
LMMIVAEARKLKFNSRSAPRIFIAVKVLRSSHNGASS